MASMLTLNLVGSAGRRRFSKTRAKLGQHFDPTAYMCMYAVELLSGPGLAFWGGIIWSKFFFALLVKNTIKIGVSALSNSCAQTFEGLSSGPSWHFFTRTQLGPDNNPYLEQIITPQNVFSFFGSCAKIPTFTVLLTSTKSWQKRQKRQLFTICKTLVI